MREPADYRMRGAGRAGVYQLNVRAYLFALYRLPFALRSLLLQISVSNLFCFNLRGLTRHVATDPSFNL